MAHVGLNRGRDKSEPSRESCRHSGEVLGKEHQPLGDSRQVKGKKYGRVTRCSVLDDRNDQSRKIN